MVEEIAVLREARVLAALLAFALAPLSASAHRLDECLQAALVDLSDVGVDFELDLTPGAAVAVDYVAAVDSDRDGRISPAEAMAYGRRAFESIRCSIDGAPVALEVLESESPSVDDLRAGSGVLRWHARGRWVRLAPGAHGFQYQNGFRPGACQFLVNALKPARSDIQITAQRRDELQASARFDLTVHPDALGGPSKASRVALVACIAIGALFAAVWVRRGRSTV